MKKLFTFLIVALCFGLWGSIANGQISIPNTTPVTENFVSIGTGTTLPANWKMTAAGTSAPTWSSGTNVTSTTQQASSGSPATGGRYNWGRGTATTDRSIGFMTSGSYASPNSAMAFYRNTNANAITSLNVGFTLERYRINSATAYVRLFYSTDGSTWSAVQDSVGYTTGSSSYGFPIDTTNRSININSLNIANNGDIYLRWDFFTTGGNSQGLGLDNVSITATFAASGTPDIAFSDGSPAAGTINQGSTNQILRSIKLDVTTTNATLTGVTMTTGGTYQTGDLQANSFKFWINSSNNMTGATQLGSSQAIVASGNNVSVSGLSTTITSGTTRYILMTCDVAYNANTSRNISIGSTAFSNVTFSGTTNKTGTDPVAAGSAQTFGAVTPSIAISQVGPSSGNISIGSANSIIYQLSLAVTSNGTDLNSITVTTGGTYQTGDLSASSFKLWYNTSNTFGTASQIGTSQAVVASGNNITFSGLTQNIANGATGYLWVTVDISSGATASRTISITSTAFSNIIFSSGTKTGTDPAAAGGTMTFAQITQATDYFRSNITSGNWNVASNWESSPDNSTWITSTLVPSSTAATIYIRNGHNISTATSITVDQVVIQSGGTLSYNATTLTINNGAGDDITIENGGVMVWSVASTAPTYNSGANIRVNGGGILRVSASGLTASGAGINSSNINYDDASILDYAITSSFSSSGVTYFPNADVNTVPIFRVSATITSVGAGTSTTFNGTFQITNGNSVGWTGNSTKIFRNGITSTGTATMTASGTGVWSVGPTSSDTAEMGGVGGTLTLTNSNGITVAGTANVTGLIILGTTTMTQTGGAATLTGNGTIRFNNALSTQIGTYNTNTFTGTYNFAGGQSIPAGTYSNLTVSNNAATLGGDLTVSGTLTLSNTLTLGAHKLTLTGNSPVRTGGGVDASNAGAEVEFNSNTTISCPASFFTGNITKLTLSGSGLIGLSDNTTVTNTLTLTNGFLDMGANTLTLGTSTSNTGTLTRTAGTIRGSFKRWFADGGASDGVFPLDNGSGALSMPTVNFNSLGTGGTLTATFHNNGSGTLSDNGGLGYIPTDATMGGVNLINLAPQYWTITAGDGLASPNYNISITGDGIPNVSNIAYIAIVKRSNNTQPWAWNTSNHTTTSGSTTNPILGGHNFTSFSDFGVGGNVDNLLPVELSGFTSTINGRDVNLNWTTGMEMNNSGFDIERKSTVGGWSKIGNVLGHGTVNTPNSYTYSDRNVTSGKYSYRLKQIDFNGNYKYYNLSNEVVIGTPTKYALTQNFPNPFNPSTNISYELPSANFVSLKIYDTMGREVANLVSENQAAGFYTVKFDASKLSSGIYFYKLTANDFTATKKLMLLK